MSATSTPEIDANETSSGSELVVTPGYWWATLTEPTGMPDGEEWVSGKPEIVEVADNNGEGNEALSVQVFGVPVTQWPRSFVFHRPVATEFAPPYAWSQPDENPPRPVQEAIRDIVASSRADAVRLTAERDALVEAVRRARGITGYSEREGLDAEAALSVADGILKEALASIKEGRS